MSVSTSTDALALLEKQKDTRQSPCIVSAIKVLGQANAVNAVPVLIGYLDFVDPTTARSPGAASDVGPNYPPVTALFQIGKPATHGLLSAIESSGTSTIRENAQNTYLFVYRDDLPSGIRQLKKEERIATTVTARRGLSETMKALLDACAARGDPEARLCTDAARN